MSGSFKTTSDAVKGTEGPNSSAHFPAKAHPNYHPVYRQRRLGVTQKMVNQHNSQVCQVHIAYQLKLGHWYCWDLAESDLENPLAELEESSE